jgi:predicted RND superfamily exporter protein
MLRKYVEFIVRFRIAVIILIALITVFIGSRIKDLRVEVDPDKNLPQSHPYVAAQNQIDKIFGGRNLVVIGVIPKDGDIFQPNILDKIMRITQKINEIPGAIKTNTFSIAARKAKDIKGTEEGMVVKRLMENVPQTKEGLDDLKKKIYSNPLFINSIISKDGKAAQIIADFNFNKELKGYPDIKKRIQEIVSKEKDSSAEIHLNGPSIALSWLSAYSQKMGKLFPLAIFVIGIVLYMVFGTFQGMFLPILTAIISVVWGLGFMGLLHVPMDPFNASTPILILAIAAGHSIQILKRYYEEYAVCGDNKIAVIESTSRIGVVMITAGVIAAVSFLSLITFDTMSIRNFGIFTSLGILNALIIEMTFIPPLRAILFGVMGYAGIALNIGTSTISAMAVGIGADYAIYYIYRLREEMGNHTSLLPSLAKTMKTSGKAITFVSISIAFGYLMLPLSGFGLHIKLGTLVALAMIVSSLTAITVLPALIAIFKPKFALKPILFK